jgi:ATP-dependent helicase/nuclease subunit A
MAKRIFTAEQKSAIETENKTLLVSAAAGSGKTATLTERIIHRLTSSDNPEDISGMLIVTFTNAAVEELRSRIGTAIREKLLEEPENKRLERQLYMLPSARISTIDSFCNDILKNNAERFGISPLYRIADPIEAKILANSVWTALIDAAYNGELTEITSPEDFEELASCLTAVKNDSALEEIFELLYDRTKSIEEGSDIYFRYANMLSESAALPTEENIYAKYAISCAKSTAAHYIGLYRKIEKELSGGTVGEEKYLTSLYGDLEALNNILAAKTYREMKIALGHSFTPLPRVNDKTDAQKKFMAARDNLKDALVKKTHDRYFVYTEEEWSEHLNTLSKLIGTLARFIDRFDKVYFEEKRRRAILEYSDIEKLTYMSLYSKDGKLTELAYSLKEQFTSVYIDEYQDVNALQNRIFAAISKSSNRFMVGDIKQSIYGFRSARPEIFADMKNTFPTLDKSKSDTASIFMSKNFRCDRGIIDFVNDIFDLMFGIAKDSIGYVDEDRLEYAKIHSEGEPEYTVPEIHLFAKDSAFVTEEEQKASDLPPLWVANKIKELLKSGRLDSGEPVTPSDIAIILRKDGGRSAKYAEALKAVGINSALPENTNFFFNSEIQLVLCLLNAIDNPRRDIYLAGLMLSPLFDFTPSELYMARKCFKAPSLWNSLKLYCEANPGFAKGKYFINEIEHYRSISEGMKVDALILRLYSETGILALAARNGCRENLMLLYNYARKFEASSFEGLYNFISYVNTVITSGAEFTSKKEGEDNDAVTIITVHKSKGLEYPIVFLADASTSLVSANDRRARVAYSDEMGIGFRTRTPGGIALVESPVYNAIIDYNTEKSLEEELRVYYVALTRARERLFITGAPSADKDSFTESANLRKMHLSPYSLKEMKSFTDILFLSDTKADVIWEDAPTTPDEKENTGSAEIEPKIADSSDPCEDIYKLLTERFSFEYPDLHLTELPEKMSISKIYPAVLDGTDEDTRLSIDRATSEPKKRSATLPEFIGGTGSRESARRGIATHNFLQFFNIENLKSAGAKEELARLVKDGFISEENSERVRLDEISLFEKSELFSEMQNAAKLYREFRFNVMLPASLFTQNEEKKQALADRKILLQGVIDCIIIDTGGNIHLIDYKTDRLTKAELGDKSLAQKTLAEKHSLQLYYYSLAIEKIFSKQTASRRVYSLPLGDTVDV